MRVKARAAGAGGYGVRTVEYTRMMRVAALECMDPRRMETASHSASSLPLLEQGPQPAREHLLPAQLVPLRDGRPLERPRVAAPLVARLLGA